MKKILWVSVAVLVTGCDGQIWAENRTHNGSPEMIDPVVYQDRATGCQYLAKIGNANSLTPRIAADGKSHMGCGKLI